MKAALGTLPADDSDWAYEIKWDGYRTIVFITTSPNDGRGRVRVQSSSGLDVTATYPELAEMWTYVNAADVVLDGEIVVAGDNGLPSFEALQRHRSPVTFQAFDVLEIDDHDTIALPYVQRRALLANVLEAGSNWAVPAHRIGGGAELLALTAEQEMEGLIAKRLDSAYVPGKRSPNWRKIKNRRRVDVVIGGFTRGSGNRASSFGALLVGLPQADGRLQFAGGVGTGFTERTLVSIGAQLRALEAERCPFDPPPPREYIRDAVWVQPRLGARIELAEFTNIGLVRHASFIELVPPPTA
jgi:bifunctional non-homologous end joining protein LigD